ncbi:MAG: multiheme c-type cytochrome [Planctomycetota bacterium]|jgi:tetratricopeptide (TPR) repeat protein
MTSLTGAGAGSIAKPKRVKYVPAVGPRLHKLLLVIFALFALLVTNSLYLISITIFEWATGQTFQNYFYQYMFLAHLVLGLLISAPVVIFGVIHIRNSYNRKNRRAVRVGYGLFFFSLLLLATGFLLTRVEIGQFKIDIKHPTIRGFMYWIHVISPLLVIWLFVLHRLAGKKIKWRVGGTWAAVSAIFAVVMLLSHSNDPRLWDVVGPESGEQYFFPSLARTASGNFIPAQSLMNDDYCRECHEDVHEQWEHSAHRFSSFNNPVYLFSILNSRKALHERDGSVRASRFCAGCHDPVPFFSGAFDDPKYDDPNYDLQGDEAAQAGVTCTVCHVINKINSTRGNGDFTIDEPIHYPFVYSESPFLKWVNRQLVKAKPAFHKKVFLKPHHKTPEFCGACHKVHLPEELNAYKWLRGQNHYDTYHLSGVSGHGVSSFYYPDKAEHNCNDCHMPLRESEDFAAQDFDGKGGLKVHDHQFPSANAALPHMMGSPQWAIDNHEIFNEGVMRVDIFGIKEDGRIDGALTAPIRPEVPALHPGRQYLIETIIRTMKMGHHFTQGTIDSNEIWLDVEVTTGGRTIGRSGAMNPQDGEVDPWAHFVNGYVIDRNGHRIDRRNAEDIYIALYDHQIPPGAADVVHYTLRVPEDAADTITVNVTLKYRKFDTILMRHVQGDDFTTNDLPIMTLAEDSVTFPVAGRSPDLPPADSPIVEWQRWNDYGIGLLRKGDSGANRGELRQAEAAFVSVEALGQPDGPVNRARVYVKEGRLEEAVSALQAAASFDPPAYPWTVAWFTGLVNKQNGFLDEAIASFKSIINMDNELMREREFDFTQDYRLLNELGQTVFERSKLERGTQRQAERKRLQEEAISWFEKTLAIDSENVTAHYNLALIHAQLGNKELSTRHRELHAKYKPDDNARDRAIAAARRMSAAANHAAEAIVIYDLQRKNSPGLTADLKEAGPRD